MKPQIIRKTISAILVFAFTTTNIPCLEDRDCPRRGLSLSSQLAPKSRTNSRELQESFIGMAGSSSLPPAGSTANIGPSDPTERFAPPVDNRAETIELQGFIRSQRDLGAPRQLSHDGFQIGPQFGKYTILKEIGRGGMGRVYLAWDERLARRVAIKVILEDAAGGDRRIADELIQRFEGEAKMASRLEHPNIIKIHEVGNIRGIRYISMQYIEGIPLSRIIEEEDSIARALGENEPLSSAIHNYSSLANVVFEYPPFAEAIAPAVNRKVPTERALVEAIPGIKNKTLAGFMSENKGFARFIDSRRLTIDRALNIAAQIGKALDHAHSKGVIHRDIKPSNVLVTKDSDGRDHIYVVDLGVAKDTAGGERLTQTGMAIGTLTYMSPEQANADPDMAIDYRADIYSLGVLLYEMLTHEVPFAGGSYEAVSSRITGPEEPLSPQMLNPEIHRDVAIITLKAMRKDRERRYQDAGEFADDISRFLNGEPIHARPVGLVEKSIMRARRHKRPIFISTAIVAAILGIVAPFGYRAIKEQERQAIAAKQKAEEEEARRRAAEEARIAAERAKEEAQRAQEEKDRLAAEKKERRDRAKTPFNNAKALTAEITAKEYEMYKGIVQSGIDRYTEAVGIDSSFEDAYFERGRLKHRLGDYAGALSDYEEARRLNEKFAAAHYFAAKIYLFQNGFTNIEKGRQLVEAMLAMNQEDDFATLGSGWVLYIDAMENPNVHFSDAEKLAVLKEVINRCERVRQKGTHNRELFDLMGWTCWRLSVLDEAQWRPKRIEAARYAFDKLTKLEPWAPTPYRCLAEVLETLGRLQEAEENFAKYIELGGDPLGAAEFHARAFANESLPEAERQRHLEAAIGYFKSAVSAHPDGKVVLRERARLFIEAKQYDLAVTDIEDAIAADPQDRQLYEILMLANFKKWLAAEGLDERQLIAGLLFGNRSVDEFPDGIWNSCKRYLLLTSLSDLRNFGEIIRGRRALTQEDVRRYGNWLTIGKVIIPPMLPRISEEIYQEAEGLIANGERARAEDYLLHALEMAPQESHAKILAALSRALGRPVVSDVSDVTEGSSAERPGLKKGDAVLEVNEVGVHNKGEFDDEIEKAKGNGQPIRLRIRRDAQELEIELAPLGPDDKLGVEIALLTGSRGSAERSVASPKGKGQVAKVGLAAKQLPKRNVTFGRFGRWMAAALPLMLALGPLASQAQAVENVEVMAKVDPSVLEIFLNHFPIVGAVIVGLGLAGWIVWKRYRSAKTPKTDPDELMQDIVRRRGLGGEAEKIVKLIFEIKIMNRHIAEQRRSVSFYERELNEIEEEIEESLVGEGAGIAGVIKGSLPILRDEIDTMSRSAALWQELNTKQEHLLKALQEFLSHQRQVGMTAEERGIAEEYIAALQDEAESLKRRITTLDLLREAQSDLYLDDTGERIAKLIGRDIVEGIKEKVIFARDRVASLKRFCIAQERLALAKEALNHSRVLGDAAATAALKAEVRALEAHVMTLQKLTRMQQRHHRMKIHLDNLRGGFRLREDIRRFGDDVAALGIELKLSEESIATLRDLSVAQVRLSSLEKQATQLNLGLKERRLTKRQAEIIKDYHKALQDEADLLEHRVTVLHKLNEAQENLASETINDGVQIEEFQFQVDFLKRVAIAVGELDVAQHRLSEELAEFLSRADGMTSEHILAVKRRISDLGAQIGALKDSSTPLIRVQEVLGSRLRAVRRFSNLPLVALYPRTSTFWGMGRFLNLFRGLSFAVFLVMLSLGPLASQAQAAGTAARDGSAAKAEGVPKTAKRGTLSRLAPEPSLKLLKLPSVAPAGIDAGSREAIASGMLAPESKFLEVVGKADPREVLEILTGWNSKQRRGRVGFNWKMNFTAIDYKNFLAYLDEVLGTDEGLKRLYAMKLLFHSIICDFSIVNEKGGIKPLSDLVLLDIKPESERKHPMNFGITMIFQEKQVEGCTIGLIK